jgi:hypothetical protein
MWMQRKETVIAWVCQNMFLIILGRCRPETLHIIIIIIITRTLHCQAFLARLITSDSKGNKLASVGIDGENAVPSNTGMVL